MIRGPEGSWLGLSRAVWWRKIAGTVKDVISLSVEAAGRWVGERQSRTYSVSPSGYKHFRDNFSWGGSCLQVVGSYMSTCGK